MKLYIGNLPYRISEDQIKELFQDFGEVESVRIILDRETRKSRGFGFVEMPSDQAAEKAIEKLDQFNVMGRNLVVKKAKPRDAEGTN